MPEEKLEQKETPVEPNSCVINTVNHGTYTCFWEDENCNCIQCQACRDAYEQNPPWLRSFLFTKYRAIQKDMPFPEREEMLSYVEPFDSEKFYWKAPTVQEAMQYFLVENNGNVQPACMTIGPDTPYHVFWAVTGGRLCSNRNKQLFVLWNHKRKKVGNSQYGTYNKAIAQLQNQKNTHLWKTARSDTDFETFYRITECCQDVFDELVRQLGKYCMRKGYTTDTSPMYVAHRNLNNMPSFKTFRKDVKNDFDHNRYKWEYASRIRGGNQGIAPPGKPTRLVIPCIHKMMVQYHSWLPNFRTRKKRQTVLSM